MYKGRKDLRKYLNSILDAKLTSMQFPGLMRGKRGNMNYNGCLGKKSKKEY